MMYSSVKKNIIVYRDSSHKNENPFIIYSPQNLLDFVFHQSVSK